MAAPTPVSAYLHSATMVKAGVFLLARLFPALAGTDLWFFLVGGTGLITLLFGAYTALFQHHLKGLLAYSTISHLGLITLLLGMGTPLGEVAAVFHIINHATFKASLFMATGIIDHETGTRDMRKLNGMFRFLPHTAVLAMTAAAAMAGVPLLNGFLSKEMFFGETLHVELLGSSHWVLPTLATVAGALAVAYSTRFIHDVFFNGDPVDLPKQPHEPPRWMKVPVEILVIICVLVGLFPQYTVQWLLQATVRDVLGQSVPEYSLALWHGFNLPLLMSVIALGSGVALYALRHRLFALHARLFPAVSAKDLTDDRLGRLLLWSRQGTDRFENGSLQRYLYLLVATACVATLLPFFGPGLVHSPLTHPFDFISMMPLVLIVLGALGTVIMHRRRYLALIPLSLAGLAVSMVFARFSAPDLALTQILVEVATVILMLLALYFLPQSAAPTASAMRVWRDRLLALAVGVGMTALCYLILTQSPKALSQFFLDNAVPGGGGANVVNVILVDFRGFDTFGESVVLAIAAVGIFAMLRDLSLKGPTLDDCGRPWDTDRHPLILAMVSRPLLPLALMVAVYLLLRGHNAPGGGFIGGLVAGSALILQYMANGMRWASDRLPLDMRPTVAIGLLIATATGVASWLFDAPFLTSTYAHVHLPWIGEFELASAMTFDLGVFMVVVGTVLLILTRLGAQSGDAPKRAGSTPVEDIGP
jgi:multicomponent K+:H+ antiporter subunit A